MKKEFDSLCWHDSKLLSIVIDRSMPGENDTVLLKIEWEDGNTNNVVFYDCYSLEFDMNFGVIAEETILKANCFSETDKILFLKQKWEPLGVNLEPLNCFSFVTNSTNSEIKIYATSYSLEE